MFCGSQLTEVRRSSAMGFVEAVPLFDVALVKQMFPVLLTFYGSVRRASQHRSPPALTPRAPARTGVFQHEGPRLLRDSARAASDALRSRPQVLQHANVETFIVFRSITPLIVCVADAFFRPHVASLPSGRTAGALFLIFLGAVGYTAVDSTFSVTSYGWGAMYVTIFCIEMVYVKDVVSHIKLSNWGLVYYNNGIGALMSVAVFILFDESGAVGRSLSPKAAAPLASSTSARSLLAAPSPVAADGGAFTTMALLGISVSCVFGLGISFFGFSVRRKISATGFTVLGCTNKIATLVVNTLAWDKHASMTGQAALLVCSASCFPFFPHFYMIVKKSSRISLDGFFQFLAAWRMASCPKRTRRRASGSSRPCPGEWMHRPCERLCARRSERSREVAAEETPRSGACACQWRQSTVSGPRLSPV